VTAVPARRSAAEQAAVAARLRAAGCVYAEEEARLLAAAAVSAADLDALVARRAAGQPLEHVVGWAEFCGLRIAVDPGVFVPRRRTEFLVAQAALCWPGATPRNPPPIRRLGEDTPAAHLPAPPETGGATPRNPPLPIVVDLCCGSGALGVALAAVAGPAEVHAVDTDPAAVRCARRNLAATGGHVYQGDLFGPLPPGLRGRVAVLLANVPYVPSGEIGLLPVEAREHEARIALDGGSDGLAVFRRVVAAAPAWLAPGGSLLTEVSERQAGAAATAASEAGLVPRIARSAAQGATVIIAAAPAGRPGRAGASLA
jgi:release factor glutamine methyltransferase